MSVVNMNNIFKSYGITEVLKGFSLYANKGEKIGLIGANGSGKTTVFKIISGMEDYKSGELFLKRGISIGYLSQLPDFNPEQTLFQELEEVFLELVKMEKYLRELENKIASFSNKKGLKYNELLKEKMTTYSNLQHRFEEKGGYRYESKIKEIAHGMGFGFDELNQKKVKNISGGEKTRLGLTKLLLIKPDLLLLDEPTNHLDLQSIQWLEEYLLEYSGTVIIISHDRYFLDSVVSTLVEIKNGSGETYHGNYTYYLKEREKRYKRRLKAYEEQQQKIREMEEAIKGLKQWGQQGDNEKFHKRAKSMQKALDKIERLDKPVLEAKKMKLELKFSKPSGEEVLKVSNISKSFSGEKILSKLNFDLYRGEKAAVIGSNGSGKTTLIKIILGQIEPDIGQVKVGISDSIGYYSQTFSGFNPEDDLVTALRKESRMSEAEARNALAAFNFTEDEVFKKIKNISGGEKSRLRLLQLMNGDYNFLLLDEPTNHLDLPSREVLEGVLQSFEGTIMVVSHDRYFLNKIIDYTYELEGGNLSKYYGDYDYYRRKKEEKKSSVSISKKDKSSDNTKSEYHRLKEKSRKERKRKNKIKTLEKEIEEKEKEKRELEEEMINPDNLDNIELLNNLKNKYDNTDKKINELYHKWEKVMEEG